MPIDTDLSKKAATEIRKWAKNVQSKLKSSAGAKATKGRKTTYTQKTPDGEIKIKPIYKDIRYNIKIAYGDIEYISFSFPRHGIFWSKGVSRGFPIGSPRKSVDWFNSIIEASMPKLESIVAEYYADSVVNAIQFKIE